MTWLWIGGSGLQKAAECDRCHSSGTNGFKLGEMCLLDVKPKSFLFAERRSQFIYALGSSPRPFPTGTITASPPFLKKKMCLRSLSLVTNMIFFLLFGRNQYIWAQPPTSRPWEEWDYGSCVSTGNLVFEQQSRKDRVGGLCTWLSTWLSPAPGLQFPQSGPAFMGC